MKKRKRSRMKTSENPAQPPRICGILIPAYNAPRHLPELLNRIAALQQAERGWRFSVLIVDDGSRPPLGEFETGGLEIRLLRHPQNRGKGAALRSGFQRFLEQEEVAAVISLDADLQHPPEYISEFLRAFERGEGDLIIGFRRRDPKVMPRHRILSNSLTSRIISGMIGQKINDSQCGFRLYSRKVLETVAPRENRFHLESEFVIRSAWQGCKIGGVAIPTIYNGAPSAIRHIPDTLNFIALVFKLSLERIKGHV